MDPKQSGRLGRPCIKQEHELIMLKIDSLWTFVAGGAGATITA
jgi:hypothetical protein